MALWLRDAFQSDKTTSIGGSPSKFLKFFQASARLGDTLYALR